MPFCLLSSGGRLLFKVGLQCLGLAQWSLVNHVRSGSKQRYANRSMCREVAWELRFDVEKDGEQPETAAFLL